MCACNGVPCNNRPGNLILLSPISRAAIYLANSPLNSPRSRRARRSWQHFLLISQATRHNNPVCVCAALEKKGGRQPPPESCVRDPRDERGAQLLVTTPRVHLEDINALRSENLTVPTKCRSLRFHRVSSRAATSVVGAIRLYGFRVCHPVAPCRVMTRLLPLRVHLSGAEPQTRRRVELPATKGEEDRLYPVSWLTSQGQADKRSCLNKIRLISLRSASAQIIGLRGAALFASPFVRFIVTRLLPRGVNCERGKEESIPNRAPLRLGIF